MNIGAFAKIVLGLLVLLHFVAMFFPFVVPGIVAGLIFKNRHPETISGIAGAVLVVVYRLLSGEWSVYFGPIDSEEVVFQVFGGLVSWGIGTLLFLAGFKIPVWITEGYQLSTASGRFRAAQQDETLKP